MFASMSKWSWLLCVSLAIFSLSLAQNGHSLPTGRFQSSTAMVSYQGDNVITTKQEVYVEADGSTYSITTTVCADRRSGTIRWQTTEDPVRAHNGGAGRSASDSVTFGRQGVHYNTDNGDYVDDDEDFQDILDRLRTQHEEEEMRKRKSAHFVADDVAINEVEQLAVTGAPTATACREETDQNKKEESTPDECAICLESMADQTGESEAQCGHKFHTLCLGRWIAATKQHDEAGNCPICREKITQVIKSDPKPTD